jgi:replicative DNA helicase
MKRIDLVSVGCHEAEANVLGVLLMFGQDRDSYDRLKLTPEHFTHDPHKLIFQMIGWMHDHEEHVDPLTVMRRLDRKKGRLEKAGGRIALDRMVDRCVPSGLKAHAEILREEHRVRVLQLRLVEAQQVLTDASDALERRDLEEVDASLARLSVDDRANVVPLRPAA